MWKAGNLLHFLDELILLDYTWRFASRMIWWYQHIHSTWYLPADRYYCNNVHVSVPVHVYLSCLNIFVYTIYVRFDYNMKIGELWLIHTCDIFLDPNMEILSLSKTILCPKFAFETFRWVFFFVVFFFQIMVKVETESECLVLLLEMIQNYFTLPIAV